MAKEHNVKKFLNKIEKVCRQYDLSIEFDDAYIEVYHQENMDVLRDAIVDIDGPTEDQIETIARVLDLHAQHPEWRDPRVSGTFFERIELNYGEVDHGVNSA